MKNLPCSGKEYFSDVTNLQNKKSDFNFPPYYRTKTCTPLPDVVRVKKNSSIETKVQDYNMWSTRKYLQNVQVYIECI